MPMREEEILKVALWAIRRLSVKSLKLSGLKELLKHYTLSESEYGIIEGLIKNVEKNGSF